MSYEIIIRHKRQIVSKVGNDWAVVGQEVKNGAACNVFGYTPEIEKTVDVDRLVLHQVVDEIDLAAIIKAVNGL